MTGRSVHDVRYATVTARSEELMFPGLLEVLEGSAAGRCEDCRHRLSYGAEGLGRFGGVELCARCRDEWQGYLRTFRERAADVFPVLRSTRPGT